MNTLLKNVDLSTQLVGGNRLELLLFYLHGPQRYGINVFKVQEVLVRPPITRIPNAHPIVSGVANIRGKTIPLIDLSVSIGGPPLGDEASHIIVTEYSRRRQGFLVRMVDRIINVDWEKVVPPPAGTGSDHYLTAVTQLDDTLVEILDVEKVIARTESACDYGVSAADMMGSPSAAVNGNHLILVADDSSVARGQIQSILGKLGIESVVCKNGREALDLLTQWGNEGNPNLKRLAMVLSDIEMPVMDGYTLTTEIRRNPNLRQLYIVLHSSLSGVFNNALVQQVGADEFVAKFSADEFEQVVSHRLEAYSSVTDA